MVEFFRIILIQPIFNALIGLYNVIPGNDLGLAIIVGTLLIRLVLLPLSLRGQKSQKKLTELQPKIKELQDKHKDNRESLAAAQMQLFRDNNVSPLGGCLPILIQLPVIISLYRVLIRVFDNGSLSMLYSFVHNPGIINNTAFGFLDLSQRSPVLAVIAGVSQFVQSRVMMKNQSTQQANQPAAQMMRQMMYMFPIMMVFIAWSLPAGLALYFVTTTVFSLGEQLFIHRSKKNTETDKSA